MKLQLPAGTFRAYLFDCDGTIVDSMPLHYIAWKTSLAEYDCVYEEKLFYAWGGRPIREIIQLLNEMQGLDLPVDEVAEKKEALYHSLLPQLKAIPEVMEHVDAQHGRIPFAVVSGSRRASVVGRSPFSGFWTSSTPWSARRTTSAASRRPIVFCWRRSGSALPRLIASSLKTPTWASMLLRLRACTP